MEPSDREPGSRDRPGNDFLIECPQVFHGAAAAGQDQDGTLLVRPTEAEQAETSDYIEFSWAGEDARHAGNLVHRLLQLIAGEGIDGWRARGGFDQNESWCRQQLRAAGIHGDRADEIVRRTARAIENCLNSETGTWLLADHDEGACEYAVTALLEGRVVNMVLDRTFVENGERWIVDYKTGEHRGGDLEVFLDSEADRYRNQMSRYREAMALTESRPIRTALYFPLLDRLLEL